MKGQFGTGSTGERDSEGKLQSIGPVVAYFQSFCSLVSESPDYCGHELKEGCVRIMLAL